MSRSRIIISEQQNGIYSTNINSIDLNRRLNTLSDLVKYLIIKIKSEAIAPEDLLGKDKN